MNKRHLISLDHRLNWVTQAAIVDFVSREGWPGTVQTVRDPVHEVTNHCIVFEDENDAILFKLNMVLPYLYKLATNTIVNGLDCLRV